MPNSCTGKMAAFNATTTSNGAYNVIVSNGNTVPTLPANPTLRQFNKWERAITGAAASVPSNRTKHDIGHVFLVKTEEAFCEYTEEPNAHVAEKIRPPASPTFNKNAMPG